MAMDIVELDRRISELKVWAALAVKLHLRIEDRQADGRLQQIADRAREYCRLVERRQQMEE